MKIIELEDEVGRLKNEIKKNSLRENKIELP